MDDKLGENMQFEWDSDPFIRLLWEALELAETDPEQGVLEVEQLANNGSSLAMFTIGEIHALGMLGKSRDREKAIHWLNRASDAGSIEGKYLLGKLLESEDQWQEAFRHYSDLTQLGFAPAMFALGTWNYKGRFIPRDLSAAVNFFEIARKHGHIHSAQWLAHILRRGELGFARRVEGYLRTIGLVAPMVWHTVFYPKSDRLRL